MTDDVQMSRLISKSLRHEVGTDESESIAGHLQKSDEARKFVAVSKAIQNSVAYAASQAAQGNLSVAPGLSHDARQRLTSSVSRAVEEKLSLSQAGLINTQAAETAVAETAAPQNVASAGRSGDARHVASEYRLLRPIGEGGSGTVWLARDETIKRNVAIKELRREALESPMSWRRFHREAEITGQLEHPNVVPVYQFGKDRESGEPFYAMRFVGKRTLADAIEEHRDRVQAGEDGSLGLHRLLSAFLDVCQAISYAHSRGVIHRDLKPENVALDSFGQVVVLDWGLAKLVEDGELGSQLTTNARLSDSSLRRTMDGDVVGTPLYMAPEQATGELDEVDTRTDIYGLGALLFAILTGSAPHQESLTGHADRKLADILNTIAKGNAPSPRLHDNGVPAELDATCVKAMARKRHLRFDTVDALAESVERWMAGQHEKTSNYESMRMEGRELRASLQSSVDDLRRNVRFMSRLPPIQQLVATESDADIVAWRGRLATIFEGLLEANSSYHNIVYCRVDETQVTELVRVERRGREATRVRIVPRSRLRTIEANDFVQRLMVQKPEEVVTSLVCNPMCDEADDCEQNVGLVAGVPVYDKETEEAFGVVLIDCNMDTLLRRQLSRQLTSSEVVVANDRLRTIMHADSGDIVEESQRRPLEEVAPHFQPAMEAMDSSPEYIDEMGQEIYGARLWLIPHQHSVSYLLRRTNAASKQMSSGSRLMHR
jgi:eukaryotic-like serine/threonine-protein kinase